MNNSAVMRWGSPLETAKGAMVLLHGRGGSAADMRNLARRFESPEIAFIAPEAPGNSWYPFPFMSPLEKNEPYLTQSLNRVRALLSELKDGGLEPSQVCLLGFSQGACLALEFVARHRDYCSTVIGLSGGLIGPPGTPRYPGESLTGITVFLGCGDQDSHIPVERVDETAGFFQTAGASVEKRIYSGMGHIINSDEIERIRQIIARLAPLEA
ncbi:MAG TPA: alpha/beta fold hydrolase [Acidobacteriota bacterium]|nr:alpha/beta fold hydrolase [Acidobacteriota bacterium]